VHEWLSQRADALAAASGLPREQFELDQTAVDQLLELAKIGAHESGERTNAPLLTYLVGVAHGSGKSLDELFDVAR
jgi:hypothetical protein